MAAIQKVLVVGGGVGGMSAAIQLRKQGIAVTIAEIDPAWKVYGAGITITGPTLRALKLLGALADVEQLGSVWPSLSIFTADNRLIEKIQFPILEPGLPGGGGILRPTLHKILSKHTLQNGVDVRLGVTVASLTQRGDSVQVTLSDGREENFDLVVGADGIFSKMRERVFPAAPKPKFTGQGCWRIVIERPPSVQDSIMYIGADVKLGVCPISATHMYMYVLQTTPANPWIAAEEQPQRLYDLLEGFGGEIPAVRAQVLGSDSINYRPLEAVLLPAPWHTGRVVLLGDAAHATTPHLASGAGMAVEDALVLAQEVERGGAVESMLTRYTERRYERGRLVVQNSLRLGEMEMNHESPIGHAELMNASIRALAQPM